MPAVDYAQIPSQGHWFTRHTSVQSAPDKPLLTLTSGWGRGGGIPGPSAGKSPALAIKWEGGGKGKFKQPSRAPGWISEWNLLGRPPPYPWGSQGGVQAGH